MIPASAEFQNEEAKPLTAKPVVWVTFLPRQHRTGVGEGGEFLECTFVSPAELRADYHGFTLGYYLSPQMAAGLGRYPSPADFTADWNIPGFDMTLSFRTARTLALLEEAAWTPFDLGDELQLEAFYQWKVEWAGYRAWAEEEEADANAFTAYAVDDAADPNEADYLSYVDDENHPGDPLTYLKDVALTGEFPVAPGDVEAGGRVIHQKPERFDEVVAGDHTGMLLNNRQGLFSPNRSNFIFALEPNWRSAGKQMRLEIGYLPPAAVTPEMVLFYLGRVGDWGPLGRGSDAGGRLQPHTVEVYTRNWITALLEHQVGYPDAEGKRQPKIMGEVLVEADKVSGWALVPPLRTADFEDSNWNEVDARLESGGGALSFETAEPLKGTVSLKAAATGASQQALVRFDMAMSLNEIFIRFPWRLDTLPATLTAGNCQFLKLQNAAGADVLVMDALSDFKVRLGGGEASDWDLRTYAGVEIEVALRVKCGAAGKIQLWVNNDEMLSRDQDLTGVTLRKVLLGLSTGGAAESWSITIDGIEIGDKYHDQAFQAAGYPFQEIKTVYVDEIARPAAYIEKFPELGAVNFLPDPARPDEKDVSGTVMLRLVKDTQGHPADQIQTMVEESGAGEFINAAAFAAAKAATPDYVIGSQFEEMTAAECIVEICRGCLFWLYEEHGQIYLQAFTGAALPAPALTLDTAELRELSPTIRMTDLKKRVVVPYGWHKRNPKLLEAAGVEEGEPVKIDLTWDSPVATDSKTMARQIADRALLREGPREDYDPVRLSLRGARLQFADIVRLVDAFQLDAPRDTEILRKEVNLDSLRETILQLQKYLEV